MPRGELNKYGRWKANSTVWQVWPRQMSSILGPRWCCMQLGLAGADLNFCQQPRIKQKLPAPPGSEQFDLMSHLS